jgi:uncharacterized protein (DUF58 family)
LLIGEARGELVLSLLGGVFALLLIYAFLSSLALSVAHRRSALGLNARILPERIAAGGESAVVISGPLGNGRKRLFMEFPALVIRYRMRLSTRDGKRVERTFKRDVWETGRGGFSVPLRGAYCGAYDEIIIADVFGFFLFAYRIPRGDGVRLSVCPAAREGAPPAASFSGGSVQRGEREIVRTDDLVEQRPYVPGDDPRRINWKLYGHSGDLFVREEDREPPPHSVLAMLVCGEVPATRGGADMVDRLCECALAIAVHNMNDGVAVLCGGSGLPFCGGDIQAIAKTLSLPFAFTAKDAEKGGLDLPAPPPDETKVLILSAPCAPGVQANVTLDRFLAKKPASATVEALFLYDDERLIGRAEACAMHYARLERVYATAVKL